MAWTPKVSTLRCLARKSAHLYSFLVSKKLFYNCNNVHQNSTTEPRTRNFKAELFSYNFNCFLSTSYIPTSQQESIIIYVKSQVQLKHLFIWFSKRTPRTCVVSRNCISQDTPASFQDQNPLINFPFEMKTSMLSIYTYLNQS